MRKSDAEEAAWRRRREEADIQRSQAQLERFRRGRLPRLLRRAQIIFEPRWELAAYSLRWSRIAVVIGRTLARENRLPSAQFREGLFAQLGHELLLDLGTGGTIAAASAKLAMKVRQYEKLMASVSNPPGGLDGDSPRYLEFGFWIDLDQSVRTSGPKQVSAGPLTKLEDAIMTLLRGLPDDASGHPGALTARGISDALSTLTPRVDAGEDRVGQVLPRLKRRGLVANVPRVGYWAVRQPG